MRDAVKIHRVRRAPGFRYVLLANSGLVDAFLDRFRGRPIDDWRPPEVFVYEPLLEAGDFWDFQMDAAAFASTPAATELVRPFLEMAGQVLPLAIEGEEFGLLNVTTCVNCLDHERTEWLRDKEGRKLWVTRYAFHEDRLPESTIFKIPEMNAVQTFCYEGLHDPEDEFKPFVDSEGLTGLEFEEVWDSKTGGPLVDSAIPGTPFKFR